MPLFIVEQDDGNKVRFSHPCMHWVGINTTTHHHADYQQMQPYCRSKGRVAYYFSLGVHGNMPRDYHEVLLKAFKQTSSWVEKGIILEYATPKEYGITNLSWDYVFKLVMPSGLAGWEYFRYVKLIIKSVNMSNDDANRVISLIKAGATYTEAIFVSGASNSYSYPGPGVKELNREDYLSFALTGKMADLTWFCTNSGNTGYDYRDKALPKWEENVSFGAAAPDQIWGFNRIPMTTKFLDYRSGVDGLAALRRSLKLPFGDLRKADKGEEVQPPVIAEVVEDSGVSDYCRVLPSPHAVIINQACKGINIDQEFLTLSSAQWVLANRSPRDPLQGQTVPNLSTQLLKCYVSQLSQKALVVYYLRAKNRRYNVQRDIIAKELFIRFNLVGE